MRILRVACDKFCDWINEMAWRYDWVAQHLYDSTPYRWLHDHSESSSICHQCCRMDMEHPNDVIWRPLFTRVCQHLGISKRSSYVLYDNLDDCNWEHLHLTEEEKKYPSSKWRELFVYDVHYCSDRWSLSRLLRVHWAYCQWKESLDREDH